jgi:translation initiation factor IF-3
LHAEVACRGCREADSVEQREHRGDHIATDDARINDRIRAREVLLIGAGGEQLGVKPLPEALAIARDEELDLVEVAPNANPPVARIMNYGRYKYEQEQRRKESRRKATNVVVKEMKFRPKIDEHDYVTKMKHVERFLAEGSKVKLTIMFRGREVFHPELGLRILERVADQVSDIAIVESAPRQDGRNMTMVLNPIKRPARARAAAAPPPPTGNGSEGEH